MSEQKGYIVYQGYAAMQHENAVQVFREFIQTIRPSSLCLKSFPI
jgi:hypothetical protein